MSHAGRSGTSPDYLPFTDTDVESRARKLVGARGAHNSSTDYESVEDRALHITRICVATANTIQQTAEGIREEAEGDSSGFARRH